MIRPSSSRILSTTVLSTLALLQAAGSPLDYRGREFIGFNSFTNFVEVRSSSPAQVVLISPVLASHISFNEVIVSWNAELLKDAYLVVEARAVYPEKPTKYYSLGDWSTNPARHPRQSIAGQSDAEGDVSTDTLILRRSAGGLQIRLTFAMSGSVAEVLKFLGISLTDTNFSAPELPPNREAWGKMIPVLERTQMAYPNGNQLCSPTTVSMIMNHWAQTLKRPELDRSVPQIVDAIYDSQWKGTGNWPFNMAYAGSFEGVRAYVTRLSDVSELEGWIACNIPVGLSVDYDRLRGKGRGPNGHLVALVGFTTEGDAIINDPGTTEHVRKVFPRKRLIDAWAASRNTVYLIYPESVVPPKDCFGHWEAP